MCCSDGVQQTTQAPPTQAPTQAPSGGNPCSTPDGQNGYCIGESSMNYFDLQHN